MSANGESMDAVLGDFVDFIGAPSRDARLMTRRSSLAYQRLDQPIANANSLIGEWKEIGRRVEGNRAIVTVESVRGPRYEFVLETDGPPEHRIVDYSIRRPLRAGLTLTVIEGTEHQRSINEFCAACPFRRRATRC
jgi:hypothetical protein